MKLITEIVENVSYTSELNEATGLRKHYITGPYLVAEQQNKNGRIYPISTVQKAAESYIKEYVDTKRAYGELGHPAGPQINLDRVSHLITELKQDRNVFIGKSVLTDTPMGNIARGLLDAGASLGVSCRGLGSLKSDDKGVMIVQEDYKISTAADIVADPSAPGAFVQGIMENVEWIYDPIKGTWREEALHEMKKEIKTFSRREIEEKKLAIFEDYVNCLTENTTLASYIRPHDKDMAMHIALGNYEKAGSRYKKLPDDKKAAVDKALAPFVNHNAVGMMNIIQHKIGK